MPQLVALGREFHEMSDLSWKTTYDDASAEAWFTFLLTQPMGCVLVIEHEGQVVGVTAAVVAPLMFNRAQSMAHEIMWFVAASHRGSRDAIRLFAELEKEATRRGATIMMMSSLASNGKVDKFYERRGYIRQETSFVKGL